VLLDAGEGQDGSYIFWVRIAGDDLVATKVLEDEVAAGFDPAGDRLLLTPRPSFDSVARLAGRPDLEEVATLRAAEIGFDDDCFDLYGCFLDSDLIILSTGGHGPIITGGSLDSARRLDFSGSASADGPGQGPMFGAGRRRFATALWRDRRTTISVWELAA
jgi:hypothetical protein